MRIVSWNCHDNFSSVKAELITHKIEDIDILVIQECQRKWEAPNVFASAKQKPTDGRWYGDIQEKSEGVGVFLFKNHQFECLPEGFFHYRAVTKFVLPFKIRCSQDPNQSFTLFAVWIKPLSSDYAGTIQEALRYYTVDEKSVFIGDFNTGAAKGQDSEHWYHELNLAMQSKGLANCASAWQEWNPTFFRGDTKLLDDHCFASTKFIETVQPTLTICDAAVWTPANWEKGTSDHCPIVVNFDW
jgi:endonuclease/exonuclease/phosphatase family metal-dependent hydrolase